MCWNLTKWSRDKFGPIFRALKKKRKKLKKLNEGNLTVSQLERRRLLLRELDELVRQEEVYWKQRSRALWLVEGDRNTKFFHQRASARKRKNAIRILQDDSGVEHSNDEEMGRLRCITFETCSHLRI